MDLSTSTQPTFQLVCQIIRQETHDVKTFIFSYPTSQSAIAFHYLSGQHINFIIDIAGQEKHCCYTLSSSPSTLDSVSITIKRLPQGVISNHFHDHFKIGQAITIKNASGKFHLPQTTPQKILLLSAGSGVTPMISILRFLVETQCNNQVIFLHSAHTEADLIARIEIDELAQVHGRCKVVYTLTKSFEPYWEGFQGRITKQMFRGIPQLKNYHFFTCGPKLFRQVAQQIFKALELPRNQYYFESFGEHEHSKKEDKKLVNEPIIKAEMPLATTPKHLRTNKDKVSIYFSRWDKYYQGNSTDSLLEQGENAGLILPYSCRAGCCGRCKAKLINGQVEQHSKEGLSINEQQEGYILLCSCIALTDIELSHE
jgi:ferredoxin-NADP reductase